MTSAAVPQSISTGGLTVAQMLNTICSDKFDLDSTTSPYKELIFVPSLPIKIRAAKIIYQGATTGTVAGGSVKLGTSADDDLVAESTAFGDAATIGTEVDLTIASDETIAAFTPVIVTWVGVAATQAGEAKVQIDYAYVA